MAQIVVRNLEESVKAKLRRRAAEHGCSMEEEVRAVLRAAVGGAPAPSGGLGSEIAALFRSIGLENEQEIPELRGFTAEPACFD